MAIHTIQNDTGADLGLWDARHQLAVIKKGKSLQNVPITITQVSRAGVIFARRVGAFASNDSYLATFVPNSVVFTGNTNVVTFS